MKDRASQYLRDVARGHLPEMEVYWATRTKQLREPVCSLGILLLYRVRLGKSVNKRIASLFFTHVTMNFTFPFPQGEPSAAGRNAIQ